MAYAFDLMAHVETDTEEAAQKILERYLEQQSFNQPEVEVGGAIRRPEHDS